MAELRRKKRLRHLEKTGHLAEGQRLKQGSRGFSLKIRCKKCKAHFEIPLSKLGKRKYCSAACKFSKTLKQRFFEKVSVKSKSECWPWVANTSPKGYGMIGSGKTKVGAHRVSWEIHKGSIPDGLQVLHKCDNPPCVNPRHLFLGTHGDNMRDMVEKHRNKDVKGEKNPMSKLNGCEVLKIRRRRKKFGETLRSLATDFGISKSNVSFIVRNESWTNLK